MQLADSLILAGGLLLAAILLVLGAVLGTRFGKRSEHDSADELMTAADRERVLQLLHELEHWTSEYSGNVSEYQLKLDELSRAVGASGDNQNKHRVVLLLQQIMTNNERLQTRLDAAEKQLEQQTRQLQSYLNEARTDGLTGLANRRAFDQKLEDSFARYRAGGRSFVVVLIDVDKFKSINDTHGHPAGDQVLRQLAQSLQSQLADALLVARFGGEEFAVILDGPLRIAAERLNEIRRLIEKTPLDVGGRRIDVTISVGLSEPRDDYVVGPVIRRADEALYTAKNIGRNRVYFDEGRGPLLVGAAEAARK